ncbi:MAG: methylmalonyl Co-A mutase-associated GTPase MeaB [Candidatus Binatia bacterium]
MSSDLARQILKGDHRAVASIISLIEDGHPKATGVVKALYARTGRAHVIGVTGAAGTGKSSLIDRLIAEYRRRKRRVGILAVDPTSPFSTGAVLGDRIRMRDHFLDKDVFIRSFATRGSTGGLARPIRDAIHLLDAMGKDVIIVETIGVGQDELDVATLAQTVAVVLMPQAGDEVQGMKAGFAEIADILVVNKADLPGADETVRQLKALFADSDSLVVATSALKNQGVRLLVDGIEERRTMSLRNGGDEKRRLSLCRHELLSLLRARVFAEATRRIGDDSLEDIVRLVAERRMDPYSAVDQIAKRLG